MMVFGQGAVQKHQICKTGGGQDVGCPCTHLNSALRCVTFHSTRRWNSCMSTYTTHLESSSPLNLVVHAHLHSTLMLHAFARSALHLPPTLWAGYAAHLNSALRCEMLRSTRRWNSCMSTRTTGSSGSASSSWSTSLSSCRVVKAVAASGSLRYLGMQGFRGNIRVQGSASRSWSTDVSSCRVVMAVVASLRYLGDAGLEVRF